MRNPNIKCEICGKPLYRRPFELKKAKHICCKDCRSELYKKYKNYNTEGLRRGQGWNKGMSKANGDELKYGKPRSQKTKDLISKRLKEVLVKNGVYIACEICSKKRYVFPSDIKRGNGRFCSKRCIAIANNLIQKESDTDIEVIIENWLKEKKIDYEKQKQINGISIPDFFIKPNLCLYCDGDYWHSIPKVQKRDIWINGQLEKFNYRVIRIKGSDIKRGMRPDESIFNRR